LNRRLERKAAVARPGFGVLVLTLALVVFAFAGVVQATGDVVPAGAPAAQGTAPVAVATGGVPLGAATGEAVIGSSDVAPPGQQQGTTGTAGRTTGGDFPWLAVIVLAAVAILGVIALMLVRSRRAATAGGLVMAPAASTATTSSARGPGAVAYGATPVAATAATAGAPVTVACPNCGTANAISENFCHECGQDLRPARQSMIAPAPAADVVTDDMPYLETLDRTDEQLEYVLSRNRVVLGTAAGSDVVIGEAFEGHETVSPRHAELRKEGDGFVLVDLDSENGTFVNEVRAGENLLSDGDEVRLGSVRFVFRVPQA